MLRKFVFLSVLVIAVLAAATAWGHGSGQLASVTASPDMGGKIV